VSKNAFVIGAVPRSPWERKALSKFIIRRVGGSLPLHMSAFTVSASASNFCSSISGVHLQRQISMRYTESIHGPCKWIDGLHIGGIYFCLWHVAAAPSAEVTHLIHRTFVIVCLQCVLGRLAAHSCSVPFQ